MDTLKLLIEFHAEGKRQGPGSERETLLALELTGLSKKPLKVADIGCGTGEQTFALSKSIGSQIIAVDLYPDFLTVLQSRARTLGLENLVHTIEACMGNLPFGEEEFDLLWSEGAIYNMGFARGIQEWRKFLKKGGYLVVSEMTWLTQTRPQKIEDYWNKEYPEIDTAQNKIRILEENGYSLGGYFTLSESSWMDHYYSPMETRFEEFLQKHNYSELAQNLVYEHKEEIKMYREFSEYYGYGFYISKKI